MITAFAIAAAIFAGIALVKSINASVYVDSLEQRIETLESIVVSVDDLRKEFRDVAQYASGLTPVVRARLDHIDRRLASGHFRITALENNRSTT